jgi:hypothetical protein
MNEGVTMGKRKNGEADRYLFVVTSSRIFEDTILPHLSFLFFLVGVKNLKDEQQTKIPVNEYME